MQDLPTVSVFLPMVPVPPGTADALAEIAWLEGQTVSYIVRRALTGYAESYLLRLRELEAGE
jgi:hypothetical protein